MPLGEGCLREQCFVLCETSRGAHCSSPSQLENLNCCSVLAHFGYNLLKGKVEISLLVFPCFLKRIVFLLQL